MSIDFFAAIVGTAGMVAAIVLSTRTLESQRHERRRYEHNFRRFMGDAARDLKLHDLPLIDSVDYTYTIGASALEDEVKESHDMRINPGEHVSYWISAFYFDDEHTAKRLVVSEAQITWRGNQDRKIAVMLIDTDDDKLRRDVAVMFDPPLEGEVQWQIRCQLVGFFDSARSGLPDHTFFRRGKTHVALVSLAIDAPLGYVMNNVTLPNGQLPGRIDRVEWTATKPESGKDYDVTFSLVSSTHDAATAEA